MVSRQPGNIWCTVNDKALSYQWATAQGFSGAMQDAAMSGTIGGATFKHYPHHIMAVPKSNRSAYMSHTGGAGWGDKFKSILGKALGLARAAQETGVTGAVGNVIGRYTGTPAVPAMTRPGEVMPHIRAPELATNGPMPAKRSRWGTGFF